MTYRLKTTVKNWRHLSLLHHIMAAAVLVLISVSSYGSEAVAERMSHLLSSVQSVRTGSSGDRGSETGDGPGGTMDFSEADAAFAGFLEGSPVFDGISYVVVDGEQVLHTAVFGDHTEDLIVMLASTSKVPAVMTLLALEEDPNVAFRMDQPIGEVLPFEGVYGDRTPSQLVSNTSGIPGLRALDDYGDHLCQFINLPFTGFEDCGETLFSVELDDGYEAGSIFDYGGSQWQLAGVTASIAANSEWNQLVDQYLVQPCGLEVFTFGNMWLDLTAWDGTPGSLKGQHNPSVEGGAITNLADYAKLLQIHLNGGYCGDTRVLSETSLASMRIDRGGVVTNDPTPYGMGWWISSDNPGVYDDPGAFGAISFIDVERGIGGYVAIDDYSAVFAGAPIDLVRRTIIPLLQAAYDAASGVSEKRVPVTASSTMPEKDDLNRARR
ncbi:MAG: serine hydrolase domain-containing protein [Luminiphilus sp.]